MGEGFRKKFDGDVASQFGIGGWIHLSHSACSQMSGNFVMCEFCSNHEIEKRLVLFLQAVCPVDHYGDVRRGSRLAPRTNIDEKMLTVYRGLVRVLGSNRRSCPDRFDDEKWLRMSGSMGAEDALSVVTFIAISFLSAAASNPGRALSLDKFAVTSM